jgi:hypothetical protein
MLRVIKLAIISAIVVFVIVYLISLLIPSKIIISRAINIEAPKEKIYPLIADTSNWKQWNDLANPNIYIEQLPSDSNIVSTLWTYGSRSIKGSYRMEKIGDVTVVQWYFEFHLKWYPWEKFGSITFEDQFGKPMERSLSKLKTLVTNSP